MVYYYTPDAYFTKNGNTYDVVNTTANKAPFQGTTGYNDVGHTFLYVLKRTVTVNYLDARTGQPIHSPKVDNLHQSDQWSESPLTLTTTKDGTNYTCKLRSDNATDSSGAKVGTWSGSDLTGDKIGDTVGVPLARTTSPSTITTMYL